MVPKKFYCVVSREYIVKVVVKQKTIRKAVSVQSQFKGPSPTFKNPKVKKKSRNFSLSQKNKERMTHRHNKDGLRLKTLELMRYQIFEGAIL